MGYRHPHLPQALTGWMRGRLRRALDELAVTISRTATIVAQTRSRLADQMPDSATRLVSLHDGDARPIRKGRAGRPVEFGHKAQVIDNNDGIVVDNNVEAGNPPDAPQLAPAISRIARRAGAAPRSVTADRGYGEPATDRELAGWEYARQPPRAKPGSHPPAGTPNMPAGSADSSSGGPAAKAGSATSSTGTAGTAPGWTAVKEP